jgi:hypothetical protein
MAQLKVRSYLTIRPTQYISPKGGMSPYYIGTIKGINRLGGVVESLGKHLEQVNTLYKFRNEFLIQSQAQRIKLEQKGILLDEKAEKAEEDKNKRWWKRFLDQKNEDESEKSAKKPESVVDAGASVVKKAISPLKKFLQQFSPLFEAFIRFTVVGGILNWITDRKTEDLAKTIGNVIRVFSFVKKLVGFGIGTLLDGLTNLFGGYDKITKGNLAGALQGLLGVGQFLAGVALIKGAQYIMMPWKLITDVGWVIKLFTEWGKINGESEGAARNKDITGYVDKNGNTISKEDFEKAKKSAARNDAKRAKQKGKGWAYSGGQDAVSDRYRSQHAKRKKNFLQRGAQRSRIGLKRATRGVRGQFKAAGNWMQANPAKGNAIFSVVGGLARAGGGLMGGENAGQAVGAGLGQATGGIAGFALGNMLLPGVGGIIGSMIGSVLGEWVGTKLGPIIDPIMKPIGNAFKLGFDIIGTAISPVIETFGEFLGSLVDGLGALFQLCGWLAKAGADVLKFAWDNSIYKKAIDGMIWVWQNKDNIGKAVGEALVQGAKGYLDTLTFNVFDFDKQNKRFAGGRVPFMAAGGLLQTDSPEVMGLKVAGNALLSTIDGALSAFGIVGDITKTTLSSDIGRLSSTFGAGKSVAFGGGRITSQVTRPQGKMSLASSSGDNSRLESIVGTKEVAFLTAQPEQFKPQNDGSIRGLLADIYNGLVSLKILGGDNVVVPSPGGPGGVPSSAGSLVPEGGLKGLTDADWKELAYIVSGEAGGGDDRFGVAAVVLNRVASPKWPNNIKAVGTQSGQFEAVYTGKARYDQRLADDLKTNQGKISAAMNRLHGRDSFKGQSQLSNRAPGDIMFDPSGNFYHYGSQHTKKDPPPTPVPTEWKRWIQAAQGGKIPINKKKYGLVNPTHTSDKKLVKEFQIPVGSEGSFRRFAAGGLYVFSTAPAGPPKSMGNGRGFKDTYGHHQGSADGNSNGNPDGPRPGGIPRDYLLSLKASPTTPDAKGDRHPIRAGVSGIVDSVGEGWGAVRIKDSTGAIFRSGHMSGIKVKVGDRVGPSTILGTQDSVGMNNGYVHAHIEAKTPALHNAWIRANVGAVSADTGADGMPLGSDIASQPGAGGGGAQTSLLGSSGEQKDVGTLLEEAFKKWSSAFGGAPAIAAVPTETPNKVSPSKVTQSTSATSTQQAVQTASEQHTSREASKPQGAIATVPMVVPTAAGGAPPAPSVVVNKARPTAMVSQ